MIRRRLLIVLLCLLVTWMIGTLAIFSSLLKPSYEQEWNGQEMWPRFDMESILESLKSIVLKPVRFIKRNGLDGVFRCITKFDCGDRYLTICISATNKPAGQSCHLSISTSVYEDPKQGKFFWPHKLSSFQNIFTAERRNVYFPLAHRTFADVLYIKPCDKKISQMEAPFIRRLTTVLEAAGLSFKVVDQFVDCSECERHPLKCLSTYTDCDDKCKRSRVILAFDHYDELDASLFVALEFGAVPLYISGPQIEKLKQEMQINTASFLNYNDIAYTGTTISTKLVPLLRNDTLYEAIQLQNVFKNPLYVWHRSHVWEQIGRYLDDGEVFTKDDPIRQYIDNSTTFAPLRHMLVLRVCAAETGRPMPDDVELGMKHLFDVKDEIYRMETCKRADVVWESTFSRIGPAIAPPPTKKKGSKPVHVAFTTHRDLHAEERTKTNVDYVIAKNSVALLNRLCPSIKVLEFEDSKLRKNQFGLPFLRDMFEKAVQLEPSADTYTYFNHDILFNASFELTLDSVVEAKRNELISERFLVVGRRTNVNWTAQMDLTGDVKPNDFKQLLSKGQRVDGDAIDYFTFSAPLWKEWSPTFPEFVVGRPAFDNWIVNRAVVQHPQVSTIEASYTSPVIHQTTIPLGHLTIIKSKPPEDAYYNDNLAKGDFKKGVISFARYLTSWDNYGQIGVSYYTGFRSVPIS